ncbi:unnamed protein product [Tenebrio molitor]|nr:unnamed protein product [Tenebrio molitor]
MIPHVFCWVQIRRPMLITFMLSCLNQFNRFTCALDHYLTKTDNVVAYFIKLFCKMSFICIIHSFFNG